MVADKVQSSNGGLYRSRSCCKLQVAIVVVVCKVNHFVINIDVDEDEWIKGPLNNGLLTYTQY